MGKPRAQRVWFTQKIKFRQIQTFNLNSSKINGEEWYTYYTFSTEKEYRKWKRYSIKQIKKRSPYMTNSYALKQFSWVSLQYGLKLEYDDTKTN